MKITFLSTPHSVSTNIHIYWSFVGSSIVFLLFFKIEFDAIFLLKHGRGHKKIILFNQKKNHLPKTKLEKNFIKKLHFPCESWRWVEWEIQNDIEKDIF